MRLNVDLLADALGIEDFNISVKCLKRELILDFRKLEIYTFGCAANHFNNPKYKTSLPDATVP